MSKLPPKADLESDRVMVYDASSKPPSAAGENSYMYLMVHRVVKQAKDPAAHLIPYPALSSCDSSSNIKITDT